MYRIKHITSKLYVSNSSTAWHLQSDLAEAIYNRQPLKKGLTKAGKVFVHKRSAEKWLDELYKMIEYRNRKRTGEPVENFSNLFEIEEL